MRMLLEFQPHLIVWEVKTPSVKRTWKRIDQIKALMPHVKVALMGDHVTALPEESFDNSLVDIVIKGGDYDFSLMHIAKNFKDYLNVHRIVDIGTKSDLKALPMIDRKLTRWWDYAYRNGNFKYTPGTYTMIGRDCWWRHDGGCTFCSWTNTFKNWRVGSVDQFMAEIENCASLGIREVFDDTGTFPIGKWLHQACDELRKFNKGQRHGKAKVSIGCNVRPGGLERGEYELMANAGFRFLLLGMESANRKTVEMINKGQEQGDTENLCKWASEFGLDPHLTIMCGFPWETKQDVEATIEKARDLFRRGWAKTLQATICIPYPGTELFRQCKENGWLKTEDWSAYDMRQSVMKCAMSNEEVLEMTRGIYRSFMTPKYLMRKVASIRNKDDLKYLWRAAKHLCGHLTDFSGKKSYADN